MVSSVRARSHRRDTDRLLYVTMKFVWHYNKKDVVCCRTRTIVAAGLVASYNKFEFYANVQYWDVDSRYGGWNRINDLLLTFACRLCRLLSTGLACSLSSDMSIARKGMPHVRCTASTAKMHGPPEVHSAPGPGVPQDNTEAFKKMTHAKIDALA